MTGPTAAESGGEYRRKRDRAGERQRKLAIVGRDIGSIPPVVDSARREDGRLSLRRFCEIYFADVFALTWSADHLRVLERSQQCVLQGGQFALAMPRGSGKTSICEIASIWALLCGHRRFVVLIGATESHAHENLETIVSHLETNELLLEDFPEVCYPIVKLERIAHRCKGQLCEGKPTRITWTHAEVVLPTIEGSAASGSIVRVAGITGRIRGMKRQRADGTSMRPDLVIIDDPQTDESADSLTQCQKREKILAGAVLGLAGPKKKIAALMPCTVIRAGDLADNALDQTRHPEWGGERTQLIYELPTSKLWDRYAEIRTESLRKYRDIREATAFYSANRAAMDHGAVIAWPERFNPDEASAIQHAMNLKIQDEAAFWAEYQNAPLQEKGKDDSGLFTSEQIAAKVDGIPHRVVPVAHPHLTAFIDVQGHVLYWCVVAWQPNFSGHVVDYGPFPDQHRDYFTNRDAKHTILTHAPGAGLEGAIYAALDALTKRLLAVEWRCDDGTPARIGLCLIDANWGDSTNVVYRFCRQTPFAAIVKPSHGHYVGPNAQPLQDRPKKPGDRVGMNWKIPGDKGERPVHHVTFDTNFWKTFLQNRISQAMGDPGCLGLFGLDPKQHRMLSEHLTSEHRERMAGSARVVDVWKKRPNAENHLLDCVVGAAVAASILGAALPSTGPAGQVEEVKPVSFAELQRQARERRLG